MNCRLAVAALAALSPAVVAAQPAELQGMLRTSGDGQYEVWCKITPTSGEESTRYLQPGRETLSLGRVRRASCTYKITSGQPLSVALTGADWACPFASASGTDCTQAFAKGSGTFELKRKTR